MILKYIGAFIIVATTVAFGLVCIKNNNRCISDIQQTIEFFEMLVNELKHNNKDYYSAMIDCYSKSEYRYKDFFYNIAKECCSSDVLSLKQAYKNCDSSCFEPYLKETIKNFFYELDTVSTNNVHIIGNQKISELKKILENKKITTMQQNKLTIYFSIFGGILFVIMLY